MKERADVLDRASKRRNFSMQRYERCSGLPEQIALIPGGIKEFMVWLRAAALRSKEYEPFLKAFGELPVSRQNAIELEEMANSWGISPHRLLADAVEIGSEKHRTLTKLISSIAMPAVAARNANEAKKAKGIEDRRMFMLGTGMLPSPKGSTVNVNASASAGAAAMTTEGNPSGLPDFDDNVVSFSEVIRRATDVQVFAGSSEPLDSVISEDGE